MACSRHGLQHFRTLRKSSKNVYMWCLGTKFSGGSGSVKVMVGFNDSKGILSLMILWTLMKWGFSVWDFNDCEEIIKKKKGMKHNLKIPIKFLRGWLLHSWLLTIQNGWKTCVTNVRIRNLPPLCCYCLPLFSPAETILQSFTHWSLASNTGLQEQNHYTFCLALCLAVSSQNFKNAVI